jgi:hypothetical protein
MTPRSSATSLCRTSSSPHTHLGTAPAHPPPSPTLHVLIDPADSVDRVAALAGQALPAVERVEDGKGVKLWLDAVARERTSW